jgi:pyruvate dehydrogenase E2 component (dihydrolipoamide acetyltransferase)
MLTKIIMPSGGQTTDEMLILKWNKKIGDFVKKGDILFEIETDKAAMTVESFAEGTLLAINFPEGEYVKAGETVAYIGGVNDKLPDDLINPSVKKDDDEYQPIIIKNKSEVIEEITKSDPPPLFEVENKVYASPLARFQARNANIKIEDAAKYVSKNLIKKNDIDNYIKNMNKTEETDHYFIDVTSMRKTIARRMGESISISPHYSVSVDIDMSEIILIRENLNNHINNDGIKISFNDIIMKAAARTVELFPLINSTYDEEKIKVYKDVNFGLAVGLANGLVVPVVKQVNKKSLTGIAEINSKNIEKAKLNKLQASDISGGTITLSNLGKYGVNNFTAIINQPESCILAAGSIMSKPVVIDREIVIRDMMNITASFDHRVIDGALGAAFLEKVKEILENPHLLLL